MVHPDNRFIAPWRDAGKNYEIYEVRIPQIIPRENLVLIVKNHNPRGDPNVYVSKTNPSPMAP